MTPEESEYMIYRGWGRDALPQSNIAPIPLYHLTGLKNHWGHGLAVTDHLTPSIYNAYHSNTSIYNAVTF